MSSKVYGVATPQVGVWQNLTFDQDTIAITFKNDSKYDWLIVFGGPMKPAFTNAYNGQANGYVNALEYPTIWIQAEGVSIQERALNASRSFDGNVWFMAIDNSQVLAQSSTALARFVVNIITYGPYDHVPPSGLAVARQTDLTNQPRIISLPMAAPALQHNRITLPAAVNSTYVNTQILGGGVGFSAQPAGGVGYMYIYGVDISPEAVGWCVVNFSLLALDAGNNILASWSPELSYVIARAGVFGPDDSVHVTFPVPKSVGFIFQGGETGLRMGYRLVAGYGSMPINVNVHFSVHIVTGSTPTSVQSVGPYGQITGPNVPATKF